MTRQGKGRILVMDDDEGIRRVASGLLEHLGCQVSLAGDGAEAVKLYQEAKNSGRPFDLVIMDLTVNSGMGGKEAMQKLRSIDPLVKAVVSSGYSTDPVMSDYEKWGFIGVIAKPYGLKRMKEILQTYLPS
jgi:CheY-like chemotaxis protein